MLATTVYETVGITDLNSWNTVEAGYQGYQGGSGRLSMLWLGRDAAFYASLKTYLRGKVANPSTGSEETHEGEVYYLCTYQKAAANDYRLVISFYSNDTLIEFEDEGGTMTIPAGTILVEFRPASGG